MNPYRDLMSDTWVATDALGRVLPGHEECGPPRPGRFVGIFYFICNGSHMPEDGGLYDVSRILAADPENPQWGPPGAAHYWGQPELGYYLSHDEWVIRRHAHLLADAGVDTLIFDMTNDRIYLPVLLTICRVLEQIRAEGEKTPQICCLGSTASIHQLWDEFYSKNLHHDLWFMWQGKPLLLWGQHIGMRKSEEDFEPHLCEFFTLRASWAWDSLPWYKDGWHQWPWVAHYPQCIGWDAPGRAENVPVAVAQHPLSNIGRSFHDGQQPPVDRYDETPQTGEGLHFAEQWRRALEVDPEFIFITGWNEWTAGQIVADTADPDALRERWCFFPGAPMTRRGGQLIQVGDAYFIDQYNREFSRDIEPMAPDPRGVTHGDNYYYQMVDGIRRYKGVRPPLPPAAPRTISIDDGFAQWESVTAEYRSHAFDTVHRDAPGWGPGRRYVNTTGRNDIVTLKVAHDAEFVYFYAETREPLTPATGPNWMLLFIDADRDRATGWEGYNLLVNKPVLNATETTICHTNSDRRSPGWNWQPLGRTRYHAAANKLMLAVPRTALGQPHGPVTFDFHWADNIQRDGDITEFGVNGDSAPPRRFNYRYRGL